jgi:hypothetical protein
VQLLPETRACVSPIEVLVGVSVTLLSTGTERQDAGVLNLVVLSARAWPPLRFRPDGGREYT